jgi:hypothetical protein
LVSEKTVCACQPNLTKSRGCRVFISGFHFCVGVGFSFVSRDALLVASNHH